MEPKKWVYPAKVAALYGALARIQPDAVHFHCYAQDLWVFSKILKSKEFLTSILSIGRDCCQKTMPTSAVSNAK